MLEHWPFVIFILFQLLGYINHFLFYETINIKYYIYRNWFMGISGGWLVILMLYYYFIEIWRQL